MESPNRLTCVYCGMEYPEGTPPHGAQILTDHIKVCEKHPMRALEEENKSLRAVCTMFVGEVNKAGGAFSIPQGLVVANRDLCSLRLGEIYSAATQALKQKPIITWAEPSS